MSLEDDFLKLSKQLYPTGRAFWMPEDGTFEGLCIALNKEKINFFNNALSLYDDILPDNANFTEDDATIWERIYGLQGNYVLSLELRKAALIQAMGFPGAQPARQHYKFIEQELRTAGFDVTIYENNFNIQPRALVVNSGGATVKEFNVYTSEYYSGSDLQTGVLNDPRGICVVGNRTYVADNGDLIIHVFNTATGQHIASEDFGSGSIVSAYGIAIENGEAYVSGAVNLIRVYNIATKSLVRTISTATGSPQYLSVSEGIVYLADFTNHNIQTFNALTGASLGTLGTADLASAITPYVIDGKLYVTDYNANLVKVFDTAGTFLYNIGTGELTEPRGVTVYDNRAYVTSFTDNTVKVFNAITGAYISFLDLGPANLNQPVSVAIGEFASDWYSRVPREVNGGDSILTGLRYGQFRYGQSRYGQNYTNKIANYISAADDLYFDIGQDYSATFFIGGPTIGSYVEIATERETQFRQLVLKLKPTQAVAFIFINYV